MSWMKEAYENGAKARQDSDLAAINVSDSSVSDSSGASTDTLPSLVSASYMDSGLDSDDFTTSGAKKYDPAAPTKDEQEKQVNKMKLYFNLIIINNRKAPSSDQSRQYSVVATNANFIVTLVKTEAQSLSIKTLQKCLTDKPISPLSGFGHSSLTRIQGTLPLLFI